MGLRLRVREVAEAKGITLSHLQRRADIGMSTARRMWFGTGDGIAGGDPLQYVNLQVLERIARVLEVPAAELIEETL
jgi:transcriptional regulator with XRE-family HTH domain